MSKIVYPIIQYPNMMLSVLQNNTNRLFVSSYCGVFGLYENLTIFNIYSPCNSYAGLYFNSTANYLLVSTKSSARIDVFNSNLTLLKSISVSYQNNYIVEYNGLLYVSSTSSFIMVLQNEIQIFTFSTLCASINTIAIDSYGIIAVNCYSYSQNNIYFYYTNGSYTGTTWSSPIPLISNIGFDPIGNLIMVAPFGIYFFSQSNQLHELSNTAGYSVKDACVDKGMLSK